MVDKESIKKQVFVLAFLFAFALGPSFSAQAQESKNCSVAPVNSSTLIKTFRMKDRADGYGILAAKDGGYVLAGDTVLSSGMGVWNAFVVKTDAKGNALWSRQFGSQSAAQGALADTKRPVAQTTDGNFVVAVDIIDFYDAKYESKKELWGDVLVAKLNTKGNLIWSTLVGDYSMDFPQKLWATPDGGVLLLAKLKQTTGQGQEIADFGAVPDSSVVIKFDKNGKAQWSKKMNWAATDMRYLADGSFVALADIDTRVTEQAGFGTDVVMGNLPAVIRLDKNLNMLWAKSIETPAMEQTMATTTASGVPKLYKAKMRISGGDFRAVEQAPDGSFIAFGRFFSAAQLLSHNSNVNTMTITESVPFIAVKISGGGEYQWAKSLKTFNSAWSTDFKVAKTSNNEFVLLRNVARQAGFASLEGMAGNLELVRVDANFNPRWIRKINIERDITGSDILPTKDGGIAAVGRIVTNEKHMIMGSLEPWEETVLIKADINGNVSGAKSITNGAQASLEDQSSYLEMRPMSVQVKSFNLPINKKVKAAVSNIKDKVRTNTAFKSGKVAPSCSYLTVIDSSSLPAGRGITSPVAKTWPQMNYENTKEVAAIGLKNEVVHAELLPILKEVFSDQVKLKDSMQSMWLTYIFPRPATRADVEAVQKKYEELGYKIDESEDGRLFVSKVGLTLHMTFSIQSSTAGKVEVLF